MIARLYGVTTALILAGFASLCQPFFLWLYSAGFPLIIAGVALHIVLDHLPRRMKDNEMADGAEEGAP